AVEYIAFNRGPVLAGDRNVAPVIESLLQAFAQFFFCRWLPNPSLQVFMFEPWDDFEFVSVHSTAPTPPARGQASPVRPAIAALRHRDTSRKTSPSRSPQSRSRC